MPSTKTLTTGIAIVACLLFTACGTPSVDQSDYIYNGINFGSDRDANFKKGVRDACRAAEGDYTKDHNKFNTIPSYRVGWENGRLKCKGKVAK